MTKRIASLRVRSCGGLTASTRETTRTTALSLHPWSARPDSSIYLTGEDGLTTVVKAGPTFEKIAENPLDDYTLRSPAISQGQIFIRTASALWAIGSRRR